MHKNSSKNTKKIMKTLRRSLANRMIGGVCGGIAEYFGLDPVLIRLLFVILAFFGGGGIILYIIMWIIMPERTKNDNIQDAEVVSEEEKKTENVNKQRVEDDENQRRASGWFGYVLILLGLLFFFKTFGWLHFSWCGVLHFWPVILVFLGIAIIPMRRWLKAVLMALSVIVMLAVVYTSNSNEYFPCRTKDVSIGVSRNTLTMNVKRDGSHAKLKIDAGACELELSEATEELAELSMNGLKPQVIALTDDEKQHSKIKLTDDYLKSRVNLALNANPVWDLELNMGVTDVNLDLSAFKVKEVEINSGATDIDLKLGEKQPKTKVSIQVGASNIIIRIPKDAACKVDSEGFLLSKTMTGFYKQGKDYQTGNFSTAKQIIEIELEGAISDFEVVRY